MSHEIRGKLKKEKIRCIPSLLSLKPQIRHAQIHGLPACDAFAPPFNSPLCCFRLHQLRYAHQIYVSLTPRHKCNIFISKFQNLKQCKVLSVVYTFSAPRINTLQIFRNAAILLTARNPIGLATIAISTNKTVVTWTD